MNDRLLNEIFKAVRKLKGHSEAKRAALVRAGDLARHYQATGELEKRVFGSDSGPMF
jgi:hypothetical protein